MHAWVWPFEVLVERVFQVDTGQASCCVGLHTRWRQLRSGAVELV